MALPHITSRLRQRIGCFLSVHAMFFFSATPDGTSNKLHSIHHQWVGLHLPRQQQGRRAPLQLLHIVVRRSGFLSVLWIYDICFSVGEHASAWLSPSVHVPSLEHASIPAQALMIPLRSRLQSKYIVIIWSYTYHTQGSSSAVGKHALLQYLVEAFV